MNPLDYRRYVHELDRRGLVPAERLCVFVSGSLTRGWGNIASDLDLYVVTAEPWHLRSSRVVSVPLRPGSIRAELAYVGKRQCDIEYWLETQVDQVLEKVSWPTAGDAMALGDEPAPRELDFLERLSHGVPLEGQDWLAKRQLLLADSAVRSAAASRSLHHAQVLLEDAVGQLRADDVESAVLSARLAFGRVVDGLMATFGEYGQNAKWRARKFREVRQALLTFDEYWAIETMQRFDPAAPERWVENVVLVCRRVIRELAV
jgi:hypothetical protein